MKRMYDIQEIAQLIDKFMAGETSIAEEDVLAQYFRTHEVSEEWATYKEMFALFDAGEVDIDVEAETDEQAATPQRAKIVTFKKRVKLFNFGKPQRTCGIGRHLPRASGREGNLSNLRTVRQARTLELLCKETLEEYLQPLLQYFIAVFFAPSILCHTVKLCRGEAVANEIIEIKIVQFIRANQVLGLLCNLSVGIRREQFRGHRRVKNIKECRGNLFLSVFICLNSAMSYHVTNQGLGDRCIHTIH